MKIKANVRHLGPINIFYTKYVIHILQRIFHFSLSFAGIAEKWANIGEGHFLRSQNSALYPTLQRPRRASVGGVSVVIWGAITATDSYRRETETPFTAKRKLTLCHLPLRSDFRASTHLLFLNVYWEITVAIILRQS